MNRSGSGSNSPTPLCEAANAASTPSGASTRSIENAQPSGGEQLERAHAERGTLDAVPSVTRSSANWQTERDGNDRQVRASSDGDGLPAATKTSAGASAYQELPSSASTRSGGCTPARYSGSSPSSAPAAAQSGTCARRQQEQHLDKHELGRDGRAAPNLELEPPCRRERGDEHEHYPAGR